MKTPIDTNAERIADAVLAALESGLYGLECADCQSAGCSRYRSLSAYVAFPAGAGHPAGVATIGATDNIPGSRRAPSVSVAWTIGAADRAAFRRESESAFMHTPAVLASLLSVLPDESTVLRLIDSRSPRS